MEQLLKLQGALRLAQEIKHTQADGVQMGLGWHAASGGATRWHNGQTAGYHTYLAIWPKGDCAVALLANTTSAQLDRCADNVLVLMMGGKARPATYEKAIAVPSEKLAAYVGVYAIGGGAKLTVTLEEDALYAKVTFQPKLRLYAASAENFFYRAVEAQVHFKRDDEGQVTGLEIQQFGGVTKGKRMN